MTRKAVTAIAILFCSWTAESQAGFMQPLFAGVNPFEGIRAGSSLPSGARELCISPCFSLGAEGYIADTVFGARNDLVSFSPRFFPALFPWGSGLPQLSHKDKDKPADGQNDNSGNIPGVLPPATPELTDTGTGGSPPPFVENRLLAPTSGVNQVPSPATLTLFGLGLAALGWSRCKRRTGILTGAC